MQKYSRRGSEKNASSRFMTQPVTLDEVQEAAKLKDDLSGATRNIVVCFFLQKNVNTHL